MDYYYVYVDYVAAWKAAARAMREAEQFQRRERAVKKTRALGLIFPVLLVVVITTFGHGHLWFGLGLTIALFFYSLFLLDSLAEYEASIKTYSAN
jgi:hypothetical protein